MKQCDIDRAEIDQLTEKFLASGGEIKAIPSNLSKAAEERFKCNEKGIPQVINPGPNTFGNL